MTQPSTLSADRLAIPGLILGCVIFGLGSLIVAFVPIGAFAIAFWRLAIALLVFLSLMRFYGVQLPKNKLAWLFAGLSGAFLGLDLALWHESIYAVGPGISTLLNSLQIFFLAAIGFMWFGERLSLWQLMSLALAISGVALIASPEFTHNNQATWGFVSGIISGSMLAASMSCIRKTHDIEATNIIALMVMINIGGALFVLPIALIENAAFFPNDLQSWGLVIIYGVVMQCFAWGLIAFAIPRLSLALTGLILLSEPVAALVIDYFWLDKPINALQWLGASVTLFAIYIGSVKRRH